MIRRIALAALLFTAAAPAVALAAQDERPSLGAGDDAARGGHLMPLKNVIRMMQARMPGKYINTTVGDQGGKAVYLVQWRMPDGRLVVYVVDAQSGAMLGRQGG